MSPLTVKVEPAGPVSPDARYSPSKVEVVEDMVSVNDASTTSTPPCTAPTFTGVATVTL